MQIIAQCRRWGGSSKTWIKLVRDGLLGFQVTNSLWEDRVAQVSRDQVVDLATFAMNYDNNNDFFLFWGYLAQILRSLNFEIPLLYLFHSCLCLHTQSFVLITWTKAFHCLLQFRCNMLSNYFFHKVFSFFCC